MELLLAALLVLMIPGLLTYLVPETRARDRARLVPALLRRRSLAATELELAAGALPGAVAPLHRRAAAQASLHGRGGDFCSMFAHLAQGRKGPGRGRETQRAPDGRPENVCLEEPGEEQDDHDERDESATDIHSSLLFSVDVSLTAKRSGPLRGGRYDGRSRRRGRVVRQRPAKPRTAVRFRSAPFSS